MSIVTRRGDGGETSLLYGGRVPKDDLHTEAYGALDEAISALGLARALSTDSDLRGQVLDLQRELFTVGAELATAPGDRPRLEQHFATVTTQMVAALDRQVDLLEASIVLPRGFVIPGGDPVAAALDLARTFVRRSERRTVALGREGGVPNGEVLRYLNRCSDLLFLLARGVEGEAVVPK